MDENAVNTEQELDLSQLIKIMWQRWYIILAAIIAIVTVTGLYAYAYRDDEFTARVTFAIRVEDDNINPATGHVLAERLVNSYVEFSTSKIVLEELRTRLDQNPAYTESYSNAQLTRMINASGRANTIVLDIRVTHGDPETATIIANELIDVIDYFTAEIDDPGEDSEKRIQNLQSIDIWGRADTPTGPSGPNRALFMAIGLLLGIMVGVLGVFLIEFFDKTVKTSRDIETKLKLRVLGIIPDYDMEKREVTE